MTSLQTTPLALPSASGPQGAAETALRAKIGATAKEFESQFLSVMLGQMLKGVGEKGPFGGGQGEAAFKSFLTDAVGKSISSRGGIGLAKDISRSMLHLQGLS